MRKAGGVKWAAEAVIPLAVRLVERRPGSLAGDLLPLLPPGTTLTALREALAIAAARGVVERRRSPGADFHRRARWEYWPVGLGGAAELAAEAEAAAARRALPFRPLRLAVLWRGGPGRRVIEGEGTHSFRCSMRTAVRSEDGADPGEL